MDLEANYDAVEGKGKVEPRAVGAGDVLQHEDGDTYLLVEPIVGRFALANIRTGCRWKAPVSISGSRGDLTRGDITQLCTRPREFRLVGRAKDVLTVQDPGE